MKRALFLALTVWWLAASAQNPLLRDHFSADPTARVFNDRVYIYPSHDINSPVDRLKEWFCMADYHVYSSENLTDWQDHGVIVTQNEVPWVEPDSYSMWAPDCVEKDGRYYFYFPSAPKGAQRGFAIGVATAMRPEGPFFCAPQPIPGVMGIDPCVLIDDDGQAYIYWSGMGIRGARLKANMTELDTAPQQMEGLPEGFKEGPFAFKRNGIYYLTFPWVRKENGTETLAYATSDRPLGPFTFRGIIMAESATGCWTNHHSITEYRGQWYLFYHHNDYSPKMDKRRAVRADSLFFNADGTIQEVKPTLRGIGVSDAREPIQLDRYSDIGRGATIDYLDTLHTFKGWQATLPKGGWLRYNTVSFEQVTSPTLTLRVKSAGKAQVVIREGGAKGAVIAKVAVPSAKEWTNVKSPILHLPQGVKDLYVTAAGATVQIDYLQFDDASQYFRTSTTTPLPPDADGFIRRWLLLEPIDKPNRSNTVFTDSYLRQEFSREYFPGQLTEVPKNGQKEKVGKQTLTWHAMDSERFNVKLFRFASGLEKQIYGVLFWAVTVIDCEEEIPNVRLAAGSNSASMWWVNGEEALLLSGDRRMVRDDGTSHRLTLKKGRNVLRGAIINGPGMSDFCLRFIDEQGQPVKGFKIL